jgi:ABC-2 type transport system ATP-binding protein
MVGVPGVLLLDEPTAGADPDTRQALLTAVRSRAAAGAAVVYTTHYLPELVELDATLAVTRSGRIVARGDRARLTANLPGEIRITLDPGRPRPALPAGLLTRVRAHARVHDDGDGGGSDDGRGQLRITSDDPPADLAALLAAGFAPVAVDIRRPDLDDLYRALSRTAPAQEAGHAA